MKRNTPNSGPNYKKNKRLYEKMYGVPTNQKGGRTSLTERIYNAGLLQPVIIATRKFRMTYPNSSYAQLYKHLQDTFGKQIFPDQKYPQNFSKVLNALPEWQAAYWAGHATIPDMIEAAMHTRLFTGKYDDKLLLEIYKIEHNRQLAQQVIDQSKKDHEINVMMTIKGDGSDNLGDLGDLMEEDLDDC